jgi:hypothetical protein
VGGWSNIAAARKHQPKFLAFVTNQELRLSERAGLRAATTSPVSRFRLCGSASLMPPRVTAQIWHRHLSMRLVTERSLPAEAAGVGSVLGSVVALIAVRLTLVITNTAELRRYPLCPPHLQDQSGVGDAPTSCALSTTGSKGSVIRLALPVNVDAGVVLAAFRAGDQVISHGEKASSSPSTSPTVIGGANVLGRHAIRCWTRVRLPGGCLSRGSRSGRKEVGTIRALLRSESASLGR